MIRLPGGFPALGLRSPVGGFDSLAAYWKKKYPRSVADARRPAKAEAIQVRLLARILQGALLRFVRSQVQAMHGEYGVAALHSSL
jgi:hypothetical protein